MVQSPGVPTLEKQEMQAVRDPLPKGAFLSALPSPGDPKWKREGLSRGALPAPTPPSCPSLHVFEAGPCLLLC